MILLSGHSLRALTASLSALSADCAPRMTSLGSIGEARRAAEFRRGPDIADHAIGIFRHQRFERFANKQTRFDDDCR